MSKNKKYYQEPVVEETIEETTIEPIAIEEPSIEESPAIEIEVEPIVKKVQEVKQEYTRPVIKVEPKKQGIVLLITRDGCVIKTKDKGNISLYGEKYKTASIGDTIEY